MNRLCQQVRAVRRLGFTMIELLVVVSIMIMMISMGVVAMTQGSNIESAKNTVVRVCNTSRQMAVASGLPVAMQIWIDGDPEYSADDVTANFTEDNATIADQLAVVPFRRLKEPLTGRYQLAIDEQSIETTETVPPEVPFIYVPNNWSYSVIEEFGGGLPTEDIDRIFLMFRPDGSCKSQMPNVALPWTDPSQDINATGAPSWFENYMVLQDATTSERAMIYVYPTTGFVHEVMEVH